MALRAAPLTTVAIVFSAAAYLWADGQQQAGDDPEAVAVARAEAATKALGGDLMRHLMTEMKSGGPAGAVRVCSEVAQDLAAKQPSHSTDAVTPAFPIMGRMRTEDRNRLPQHRVAYMWRRSSFEASAIFTKGD